MKYKQEIQYFKRCGWPLAVMFLIGVVGGVPQISSAKSGDGSVHALRDPFWPTGYEPKIKGNPTAGTIQQRLNGDIDWNKAMKQVVINGVSSRAEDEYIAVINNEVKSVGESVSIWYGGTRYTWKVDNITPPGSVKLRRVFAE